jgi:tetratricopeptide (TPR) repeat protein
VDARRLSYRRRLWVLAAAVAFVGVVVYLPALANGFTNWDDPGYILENSHLGPLDLHFLAWAFTTFRQANWHPLTWLSLGVDRALFGLDPLGYHLSNVLLHGATTLIVVLLVGWLFGRARGACDGRSLVAAAVAGLIFAVHPLHVESVAWVSERKDVLCGVFYVFAVLCYLRFAEHHRKMQYLASLGAFALALLAKPMAVSLPVVLLILDAYPLARLTRPGWTQVVVEKVPFVSLGIASSVATIVAQWRGGALVAIRHIGLGARLWVAERGLGFYLAKLALPINLSPIYPLESEVSPWRWDYLLSLALVLGVSATAVVVRRRAPLIGALWVAYLVMLLPAIGIVQVGQQAAADRYMYLPLLAPAIGIASLVIRIWQGGRSVRTALLVTALVTMVSLSILTIRQIGVWRDSPTLWAWVIKKQPGAAMAHYNLGEYLRGKGDLDGAGRCWRRAAEIEPSFSWPLNQLGNLAVLHGTLDEARSYYDRATRVNMYDAEAQYNFATFLEDQGEVAEALVHYQVFLRVAPPSKFAYMFPEVRAKLALLARPQGLGVPASEERIVPPR